MKVLLSHKKLILQPVHCTGYLYQTHGNYRLENNELLLGSFNNTQEVYDTIKNPLPVKNQEFICKFLWVLYHDLIVAAFTIEFWGVLAHWSLHTNRLLIYIFLSIQLLQDSQKKLILTWKNYFIDGFLLEQKMKIIAILTGFVLLYQKRIYLAILCGPI